VRIVFFPERKDRRRRKRIRKIKIKKEEEIGRREMLSVIVALLV
jgi:hypothetical protein